MLPNKCTIAFGGMNDVDYEFGKPTGGGGGNFPNQKPKKYMHDKELK